jgi:hypothetical protein
MKLFRPLLIAMVALAISAAVALAAQTPDAATDGLTTASDASGRTVPAVEALPSQAAAGQETAAEAQAREQANAATDEQGGQADCTANVGEEAQADQALEADAHGDAVCSAAQSQTPDGYATHGAYVSETARDNAGTDASAAAGAKGADHAQAGAGNASAGLDVAAGAGAHVDAADSGAAGRVDAAANAGAKVELKLP